MRARIGRGSPVAHIIGTRAQPGKRVATSGGRKSLFAIQSKPRVDLPTVLAKCGGLTLYRQSRGAMV